jgi:hypothetical protein
MLKQFVDIAIVKSQFPNPVKPQQNAHISIFVIDGIIEQPTPLRRTEIDPRFMGQLNVLTSE